MPKMRVYELARELSRENKEVIEYLRSKGADIKSHASTIEESVADEVRQGLGKGTHTGEAPKKKKNIIRVFRAQNASDGGKEHAVKKERRSPQNRSGQGRAQGGQPKDDVKATSENASRQEGQQKAPRNGQGRDQRGQNQQNQQNQQGQQNQSNRGRSGQGRDRDQSREQGQGKNDRGRDQRSNRNANRDQGQGRGQGRDQNRDRNNQGRGQGRDQNRDRNQGQSRDRGRDQNRNNQGRDQNRDRSQGRDQGQNSQRSGQNRSSGQFNKGKGGFSRPGQERRDRDMPSVEAQSKNPKESKKERDRSKSKNTKNTKNTTQGRRPNQNGGRRPNMRLPKALQKPANQHKAEEKKPEIKEITLPEKMTIRELAETMKMQPSAIVKKLFLEGVMVTVNHEIDFEKAQEIALSYDIIAEPEEKVDVIEELLREEEENVEDMVARPPVVCVMGHVDHGKTSLLDAIRNTNVTDKEAGGITQHIGASVVTVNGQKITFLDTPGHEAFTAMRMRGANATDIAILVVAADDGVMPQTVEAINHAKAAGIEIVVAINKVDKPSANIERVKQELSEHELIPEDWGGSTIFVPVSAHTGEGIDTLLEMMLLVAEVAELKANPKRQARGLVIEAELDKGKGPVATILVQKGTLHVGDFIAAGACSGKVRAMMDDKGRRVKSAGPSVPVEILGLSDVPNAGEILVAFDNDKEAKSFAQTFVAENKKHLLEDTKAKLSLDDLFDQIQAGTLKELPIIIKADVQGSVEAVKQSLLKLTNEEVVVKVIHGGVGAINESDVTLASTSNAIVIGFNVRPDAQAKAVAEQEGVDLRLYKVIYQAIEDVESAMKGMLDPIFEEQVIGHGEVRQTFHASGIGTIAGSYVLDGRFERNCKVRLSRDGEQIYEGALASLQRFQDAVKEVKAGYECGLVLEDFNDIVEGDQVEAYIMVEVPR